MIGILLSCFLSITSAMVQVPTNDPELRVKQFNLEKGGLAIQGYDATSYFSGKPEKGSKENAVNYKGVLYYFASVQNKELFKANPAKYEPAYGGWCAYAMGVKGEKVEVDAANYKIIDGKVYLFYKTFYSNTINDWNDNEASLHKKADQNWGRIYK